MDMDQHQHHRIKITTRYRVLRAWENSMEAVREFEMYAHEIHDDKRAAQMFAEFAEEEGKHAAALLDLLHEYES